MSLSFTDIPRFVAPEVYQQAIDRMVDRLKDFPGLVSIYQVGGISTPGISDIDLFGVFADKIKVEKNPVENLSPADQYLFTHNLFGTSELFVSGIEKYTYFGKYRLLFGKEQKFVTDPIEADEEKNLKKQIALEYLIKACVTSAIEHSYHTIKLRNLFLHAKALLIDLSFLGIENGKLEEAIQELVNARNNWFQRPLNHKNLNYLAQQYHTCLVEELSELLEHEKFYLPSKANLQISRNIKLISSGKFSVSSEGLFFPKTVMKLHSKLPKLLNKVNHFGIHVPLHRDPVLEITMKRYNFIREIVRYQKMYLPNFIPTAFGLNVFSEERS